MAQIVDGGVFWYSVVFVHELHELWGSDERAPRVRLACVDVIGELLSSVEARRNERQQAVKHELVAAFLLACALRDDVLGRPLLRDVEDDVFHTPHYFALRDMPSLHAIVEATRQRFG